MVDALSPFYFYPKFQQYDIEVCYLLKSIQTKLTAIIIDREQLLVIQENENEEELGTYGENQSYQ